MRKIFNSLENLFMKSLWAFGLASLIFTASLSFSPSSYAATLAKEVIQPFELTKPAATRSEAYEDIAKLNKDPKALIAAENKEERAEEKAYKAEQKAAENVGNE